MTDGLTETFTHDELWPREPQFRYRLYLKDAHGLQVLNAAPEVQGATLALATRIEESDMPAGIVGLLDATEHRWILNPFPARA